jgi:hypothetical protein
LAVSRLITSSSLVKRAVPGRLLLGGKADIPKSGGHFRL